MRLRGLIGGMEYGVGCMDRVLRERFGLEKHIRVLSLDRTLIKAL